jgi:hypothetical protein
MAKIGCWLLSVILNVKINYVNNWYTYYTINIFSFYKF